MSQTELLIKAAPGALHAVQLPYYVLRNKKRWKNKKNKK